MSMVVSILLLLCVVWCSIWNGVYICFWYHQTQRIRPLLIIRLKKLAVFSAGWEKGEHGCLPCPSAQCPPKNNHAFLRTAIQITFALTLWLYFVAHQPYTSTMVRYVLCAFQHCLFALFFEYKCRNQIGHLLIVAIRGIPDVVCVAKKRLQIFEDHNFSPPPSYLVCSWMWRMKETFLSKEKRSLPRLN